VETYFTIGELAKYLNYAEKTIRKWVLNREIPFHKIHKTIRFRLSEIEKWIDGEWAQGAGNENETDEGVLFNGEESGDVEQANENTVIGGGV
jgi:excisionase family DNA binding protein